jgi:hypothetical protein
MLAAMLDHGIPRQEGGAALPREAATGLRHHADIDTWLVARGPWRATITANDWQYMPEGHASGGALSLLWHERVGPLVAASLTRYQLVEPNNQPLPTESMAVLTPAVEVAVGGTTFTSLDDLTATVESRPREDGLELVSAGLLRDGAQQATAAQVAFRVVYRFGDAAVQIRVQVQGGDAQLVLPLIASKEERATASANGVAIVKAGGTLHVASSHPLRVNADERIFNHVPGFQALVLRVDLRQDQEAVLDVRVE